MQWVYNLPNYSETQAEDSLVYNKWWCLWYNAKMLVQQANDTYPISASYLCQAVLYYTLHERLGVGPQMGSLPVLVYP